MAWNAFKANPLFGLGYGNFTLQWKDYYDRGRSRLSVGLADGNHSTILGIMADLGLAGTVPFVVMVMTSALLCWSTYRLSATRLFTFESYAAVVALAGVLVFVVLGLTNDLKSQPVLNTTTFWWVGVASSLRTARLAARRASDVGRSSLRPPLPSDWRSRRARAEP
jgi:O-antigen ligase